MGNKPKKIYGSSQSNNNQSDNSILININNFASEHPFITVFSIIITILLAIGTSYGLSYVSYTSEQKHIAQGISNEIDQLNPQLSDWATRYIDDQQKHVLAPLPRDPIYTKDGLFYLYGKDLNKLNPTLSSKLFDFYSNVTRAETLREDLRNNCFDLKENPDIVICNYTYYNEQRLQFYERILHATNDVGSIRPLLNETIRNPLALW